MAGTACNSCLLYAAWQYADLVESVEKVCKGQMLEISVLLLLLLHVLPSMQGVSFLCLVLLEVHLVRRMLETAYILHYPRDAKMHLIAYIFGLR